MVSGGAAAIAKKVRRRPAASDADAASVLHEHDVHEDRAHRNRVRPDRPVTLNGASTERLYCENEWLSGP